VFVHKSNGYSFEISPRNVPIELHQWGCAHHAWADVFYGSDNSIGGKQAEQGSLMSLCIVAGMTASLTPPVSIY